MPANGSVPPLGDAGCRQDGTGAVNPVEVGASVAEWRDFCGLVTPLATMDGFNGVVHVDSGRSCKACLASYSCMAGVVRVSGLLFLGTA